MYLKTNHKNKFNMNSSIKTMCVATICLLGLINTSCSSNSEIQTGTVGAMYFDDKSWITDTINPGDTRTVRKYIPFKKDFKNAPKVFVSLKGIDTDKNFNTRLNLYADTLTITNKGFDLIISTWADTKIYYADANWFAVDSE